MYAVPASPSSSASSPYTSGTPHSASSGLSRSSRAFQEHGAFHHFMSSSSPRSMASQSRMYETGTGLERTILRSWIACEVPVAQMKATRHFCHRLADLLNQFFDRDYQQGSTARPRFVVDVFGSVAWGGQTGVSGDLDLIARVSDNWRGELGADGLGSANAFGVFVGC